MQTVYHIPAPDMDEKQIPLVRSNSVNIKHVKIPAIDENTKLDVLIDSILKHITDPNPVLLGFCYGAVIAQEVAKKVSGSKVIVVSGIVDGSELPKTHKLAARIFCWLPAPVIQVFGYSLNVFVNDILRLPIKVPRVWLKIPQNKFIIKHSLTFRGLEPNRVYRIHGDEDGVLPVSESSVDRTIESGGHFMFFEKRHKDILSAIEVAIETLRPS